MRPAFPSLPDSLRREQLKLRGYTDEQVDKFRAKKVLTEGDQYEPDRFNVMKPGTYYNKLFSALR